MQARKKFLKRFRWSIFYVFPSLILIMIGLRSSWDPSYNLILNYEFFRSYIFFTLMGIGYLFWSFIYFLQEIIFGKEYLRITIRGDGDNPHKEEEKGANMMFKLYKILLSMIFAFAFSDIVANKMTSLW